jgi:hypothetical protein
VFKLFSVDDHIVEPPGVWVERVPAAYKDRVPHVVEADGRQMWVWEGGMEMTMGLNAVADKPREQWGAEPARFEDMIPGCYDPHQRKKDFLSNGVFASVAFPTLPGFAGRKFGTFEDKDLALVCVRAWNDFILDEWCPAAPEMYVPMTIAPVWDAQLAAEETARCIGKGSKALCWMEDPANIGLPGYHTDYWHPLFAVCQDADIPVCMHIGGALPRVTLDGTVPMVEIAAAIERADRQWDRHQYWTHVPDAEVLPSTVARRNMWFCMIEEPVGLKYRYDFTVDHILCETDYPHADTPFPTTQAAFKTLFEGVPADEVAKMTHANAEELFRFPMTVPEGI